MRRITPGEEGRHDFALALDEICRLGAQQMLAVAPEAEVEPHIDADRRERDERGHALVVRNGRAAADRDHARRRDRRRRSTGE
jgi:hypothetical protein